MPALHHPLAAAQEPTGQNNENAAVHRAYRLISLLRQPLPAQLPVPKKMPEALGWQETKPEARPRRAG